MERRVKFRGRETRTTTRNETKRGKKSKKKKWDEKRERASCPGARRDTVRVHEQAKTQKHGSYI